MRSAALKVALVMFASTPLFLPACDSKVMEPDPNGSVLDQCLRASLFERCLASVPKGPTVTSENPWHKIVDECQSAATYQSYRMRHLVKPECRAGGQS